jgi:thiol:disulfide interchange protein DsbD
MAPAAQYYGRMRLALPAAAVLAVVMPGCAAPRASRPAAEAPLVTVDLLPDTAAISPGRPFRIGTRFRIAPGWHIYAEDPGDSGLPTRVVWQAPPGHTVGPTHYPPPVRFESPGPVVSYGYAREVVLQNELVPPPELPASVRYRARASWLACRESCIPGQATVEVTLPARR